MVYDFEVSAVVPATGEEVFRTWMSSDLHTAMTGGDALVNPEVGGRFSAWGEYITGRTVELEPFKRIVQEWRTSEFADDQGDSQIEITLEPVSEGTLVRIRHTNVPDDLKGYEQGGWPENYFDPMRAYFDSI